MTTFNHTFLQKKKKATLQVSFQVMDSKELATEPNILFLCELTLYVKGGKKISNLYS